MVLFLKTAAGEVPTCPENSKLTKGLLFLAALIAIGSNYFKTQNMCNTVYLDGKKMEIKNENVVDFFLHTNKFYIGKLSDITYYLCGVLQRQR